MAANSSTTNLKHRQGLHHLSSRANYDSHGWVESISNLKENQAATDLLNNGSTLAGTAVGSDLILASWRAVYRLLARDMLNNG